jgi:hypothetical protein
MTTYAVPAGAVPKDSFAARLAVVRVHAGGINMTQAAKRAGLDAESWRRYEQGRSPVNLPQVVHQIAEAFGVDREWLMWGGPLRPSDLTGGTRRVPTWALEDGAFGAYSDEDLQPAA